MAVQGDCHPNEPTARTKVSPFEEHIAIAMPPPADERRIPIQVCTPHNVVPRVFPDDGGEVGLWRTAT